MTESYENLMLPPAVVSRADIAHLVNELESIDNERTTSDIRERVGSAKSADIALSKPLASFLEQNNLSIDNGNDRSSLIKQMRRLKEEAPAIHMTFAVAADRESLQQLVAWVRESVHPRAVVEVGLQPGLVAGASVRTPNHVHDFSLKGVLEKNRHVLVQELGALREDI